MNDTDLMRRKVPGISVVIPHYGDPAPTLALVKRLRDEPHGADQVIVADDCSPQPFPPDGADLVWRGASNRGFGATVNAGARLANHELLLIMNSDLEPEPGFVRRLVLAAEEHLPAICSPSLVEDAGSQGTAYKWPDATTQCVPALLPLARFLSRPFFARFTLSDLRCTPGHTVVTDWVASACVLLRLEDFARIGGYDEGFYMYGEDTDLCRGLALVGVPSVYVGGVQIRHGHGASSDPARIGLWNAHARFRYAEKWGFRTKLGVGLAVTSGVNFVYNVARRVAGKDVRPLERLRYDVTMLRFGWSRRDPRESLAL